MVGLLFSAPSLFAQPKTLTGKVTDAETGDAIPFANVYFKGTTTGTTTDFDGRFVLKLANGIIPGDSLLASSLNYQVRAKAVNRQLASQTINFQLQSSAYILREVVISSGENPAFRIMREVVRQKGRHDKRSLEAYHYESYTKVEVDVDNISDRFRNKKVMKKITRVVDSLARMAGEDGKPILPLFISEALSNYYYRANPVRKRENILKTKITGVGISDGSIVSQVIGSSFQEYNFYENWLRILNKDFISPIADGWKGSYEYFLADSLYVGNFFCYRIEVEPKRQQDLAFTGTIWIDRQSYALVQIDVTIGKEANLNFIEKIKLQQELEPAVDSTSTGLPGPRPSAAGSPTAWLPSKTRVLIDISEVTNNSAGMLAKFYTSNQHFVVNQPQESSFYDVPLEVAEDSRQQEDGFWDEHRHAPLTDDEKKVFVMIDSIKNVPVVKTYVEIANILVNGYKTFGKIDVGPYSVAYANNNIEGNRFRLGFRTNDQFSRKWVLKAYGAYGTRDRIFKYGAGVDYLASRKAWTVMGLRSTYDLERLGATTEEIGNNTLVLAATKFGAFRRAYFQEENVAYVQREIKKGFNQNVRFRTFTFRPQYPIGQFAYYKDSELGIDSPIADRYRSSELTFETRLAKDERYIQAGNERISLGADKWPILVLRYTLGMKGVLNSDFRYDKFSVDLFHSVRLGALGRTNYILRGGYIPSTLPYPMLRIHLGNQSAFYYVTSFNLMNYYEFISDQYASLHVTHRFEGLLFNRIPLVKKWKLRFLATADVLYGSLRPDNISLIPSEYQGLPVDRPSALGKVPYAEVGYGVDNIFRFIRVDFLHRLTYRNRPEAQNFGVKVSASFSL
ncbi:MAG: carboxypeptidase-like regulatory domain-containing protein [Ferruginibacter sp.]|nr:carboxypeptidase-like regulatory domain-containing protein [Cytophagales bacterium]